MTPPSTSSDNLHAAGKAVEDLPPNEIQFISIATNDYLSRWKSQVTEIRDKILDLNWSWLLLTENVEDATAFVASVRLQSHIEIQPILPFGFPLASMIRYPAILNHSNSKGWLCYIDADMRIEDAEKLDAAIRSSNLVNVVSHPGYTRLRRVEPSLGLLRNLANLMLEVVKGGLGDWETRRRSQAYVPRLSRKTYVQAALFFGPAEAVHQLSQECWRWMEKDLRNGIIPRWHDESYLNRWTTLRPHSLLGPEFCFFDFPWLTSKNIVVRAIDKTKEPVIGV